VDDGIAVIDDIFTAPGVDTLEGRIGPLLAAARGACHYIELPAGGYCEPHAHPTESLIYTARGQWVLCAGGERRHMREGSLFWFGDNVPTGYEIPFDEPATILIFKTQPAGETADTLAYLKGMAADLEADNASGTPYRMDELPADHPARIFGAALLS
jgi:quercetin dioxygenase-like cupin family protein